MDTEIVTSAHKINKTPIATQMASQTIDFFSKDGLFLKIGTRRKVKNAPNKANLH